MELSEIMKMQAEFDRMHGWFDPIGAATIGALEHGVVCLTGELGEFANVVKKVVRGDFSYEEALPMLKEELVDEFIYLVKICNQMQIDLEAEYLRKLSINQVRFKSKKLPDIQP